MFGRNPCFPFEAEKMAESVSVERAMEDIDKAEIDDYISDIIEKQKATFPKADNNIKVAQEKQKSNEKNELHWTLLFFGWEHSSLLDACKHV